MNLNLINNFESRLVQGLNAAEIIKPQGEGFDFLSELANVLGTSPRGVDKDFIQLSEMLPIEKEGNSLPEWMAVASQVATAPVSSEFIPIDFVGNQEIKESKQVNEIELKKTSETLEVSALDVMHSLGIDDESEVKLVTADKVSKDLNLKSMEVEIKTLPKIFQSPIEIRTENHTSIRWDAALADPKSDNEKKMDLAKPFAEQQVGDVGTVSVGSKIDSDVSVASKELSPQVSMISEKIKMMSDTGGGRMKVSLQPEHLGEVELEVITRGNKVLVQMKAENSTTKHLFESLQSDLKHALSQQDLVLTKFEVDSVKIPNAQGLSSLDLGNSQSQSQAQRPFVSYDELVLQQGHDPKSFLGSSLEAIGSARAYGNLSTPSRWWENQSRISLLA